MALLTLKTVTDVGAPHHEILEFHGELDQSNLPQTEKSVLEIIEAFDRKFLVFDFKDLKFINSEGIGFLVSCHLKLMKREKQLVVCNMTDHVADVFELIGLSKLVPVTKTLDDARAYIHTQT